MANVLLLRSPTADGPDKYESAFKAIGYHPISVPVLETVLVNLHDLENILRVGPDAEKLSGVVITSARSCEAWKEAVQNLVSSGQSVNADWTETPFYVVGQATANSLSKISEVSGQTKLCSRDIRGANESGTSEKLAYFILEDLPTDDGHKTLLYLTGDKNRDTLSNILLGGGLSLTSLQSYKTQGSSRFAEDLQKGLASASGAATGWWIVYFAPSAAEFVTPILRRHPQLADSKVAAIGPTTATYLRDELKIKVDTSPAKPNPESLATAVHEFDEDQRAR